MVATGPSPVRRIVNFISWRRGMRAEINYIEHAPDVFFRWFSSGETKLD